MGCNTSKMVATLPREEAIASHPASTSAADAPSGPRTAFPAETFEELVSSVPTAALILDNDGNVQYMNDAVTRLFGYSRDEIQGEKVDILVPERLRRDHEALRTACCSRSRSSPTFNTDVNEMIGRRKNGTEFPVDIAFRTLTKAPGPCVAELMRDITSRRRFEERLNVAVESSPCGILVVDAGGRIELVNTELERMFGYSRLHLLGQPIEWLVPDDAKKAHVSYRKGYMSRPLRREMGAGRELSAKRRDGSLFPVEIALNPIFTSEGPKVLATVVDITQRIKAAKERQAADELVLAFFGHQLRNPIHVLENLCTEAESRVPHDVADQLREMHAMVRRLDCITRETLTHHELTSGRMELRPMRIDIRTLLRVVISRVETDAAVYSKRDERLKAISLDIDDSVPNEIVCDPAALDMLFVTVLSKAVASSPEGVKLSVRTIVPPPFTGDPRSPSAIVTDAWWVDACFQATDAMNPQEAERSEWSLHFTVEYLGENEDVRTQMLGLSGHQGVTPHSIGSIGLRWAIVRQLAMLLSGRVGWLENSRSRGHNNRCQCLFFFQLPVSPPEGPKDGQVPQWTPKMATSAAFGALPTQAPHPSKKPRVLVVEDETVIRRVNRRLLEGMCFSVDTMSDGEGVEERVINAETTERPYDAVMLDIIMKKTHGDEVCQRLRDAGCTLPIIAATANASAPEEAKYRTMGFSALLGKPFRRDELQGTLQALGIPLPPQTCDSSTQGTPMSEASQGAGDDTHITQL